MRLREALLADIVENPDDDTPRLVMADWLEENGDPVRAEFIRLQVLLAKEPNDPALADEQERSDELEEQHRAAWLEEIPHAFRGAARFRRGFVEEVNVAAWQFVRSGARLFRSAPVVVASLSQVRPHVGALAACPELRRLRHLGLWASGRLGPEDAQVLFDSPYLSNLRGLDLSSNSIGAAGAEALGRANLSDLERLNLAGNTIRAAGVFPVVHSPHLGHVRRLILEDNTLGDLGAEYLAASPMMRQLVYLDLSRNAIGRRGLQALAQSPRVTGLRTLVLALNAFRDTDALILAESPWLTPPLELILTYSGISVQTARALEARFGTRVNRP